MRGILISTLIYKHIAYERAYEMDSQSKHTTTSIYMCVLMRGILISTLIQAYI